MADERASQQRSHAEYLVVRADDLEALATMAARADAVGLVDSCADHMSADGSGCTWCDALMRVDQVLRDVGRDSQLRDPIAWLSEIYDGPPSTRQSIAAQRRSPKPPRTPPTRKEPLMEMEMEMVITIQGVTAVLNDRQLKELIADVEKHGPRPITLTEKGKTVEMAAWQVAEMIQQAKAERELPMVGSEFGEAGQ